MLRPWLKVALLCSLFMSLSLYAQSEEIPLIHQPLNYGIHYNAAYLQFNQNNPWLAHVDLNPHDSKANSPLIHIPNNQLFYNFSYGYIGAKSIHQAEEHPIFNDSQFYIHGGLTLVRYQKFNLLLDAQLLHQDEERWQPLW